MPATTVSGFDGLRELARPAHLVLAYSDSRDLLGAAGRFLLAGLEAGERGLLFFPSGLPADALERTLASQSPRLEAALAEGLLRLTGAEAAWFRDGRFDAAQGKARILGALEDALRAGASGLRVVSDLSDAAASDWEALREHEGAEAAPGAPLLTLCAYRRGAVPTPRLLELFRRHGFTVVPREGRFELLDSRAQPRGGEADDAALRELFASLGLASGLHEMVYEAGQAVDYVFLEVNPAFEAQTGLRRADLIGRRVSEVLPGIRSGFDWVAAYARVVESGVSAQFEQYSPQLDRWYSIYAYRTGERRFATLFSDISERRRQDAERERLFAEVERERRRNAELADRERLRAAELATVFESTHAQLALLDPQLRFLMVNSAYVRGCGHPREALIGRSHFELFPHPENQAIFERVRDTGEPYYAEEKPFTFPDDPGRGVTYWNWSLVATRRPSGEVGGLLLSLFDVTGQVLERRRAEALRQDAELARKRLELAQSLTAALSAARTPDEVARLAHERGFAPLGASRCCLWTPSPEALVRAGSFGPGREALPAQVPEPVLRAAAERSTVWAEGAAGGIDLAALPLPSEGRPCAVFEVRFDRRRLEPAERGLLQAVADLAGQALDRAWAFEEARREAALRERFMAILSHDLRTPLSAVLSAGEALQRRGGLTEPQGRSVGLVIRSARRMAGLIDSVLDWARIASQGALHVAPEAADLLDLAQQVIDEVRANNPSREVRLRSSGSCAGSFDPHRLQQVLTNLLVNALVHGDPASAVDLSLEGREEAVTLAVHNQGEPIPPESQARVFEPFQRGSGRARSGGLGLGLHIVREIVRAHGGSVEVRSAPAEGTTFLVRLPRRPPSP